jgi:hypothetical protein
MTNTTITMDSIKKGSCQFNATSAKTFRATLAKWHNATFEIADELLAKNDRVKALRTLVDSNAALIAKLNNGESIIGGKTAEELGTEIEDWKAKIQSENDAMAEYRKAQVKRLEGAERLVSKSIYEAYTKSITDGNGVSDYTVAIAQFLSDNGVDPCEVTIDKLVAAVGKKANSARNMCKSGKHNGTFSFQQWRKIFLGELCDIMGDALPLYKFKYELKSNRKSADK